MNIRHTLILLTSLLVINVNAQIGPNPGDYDSLFVEGASQFAKVLRENVVFPRTSKNNKVQGLMIVEIFVSKEGKVQALFMTRLDQAIEDEMLKLIAKVSPLFVNHKRDYTRFLAISFNQGKTYWRELARDAPEMSIELKHPFIGLAEAVAPHGTSKKMLKYYQNLRQKLQEALDKEDYELAFEKLNEMIRLNPFNSKDILLRQEIEQKLGQYAFRKYDLVWLRRLRRLKANLYR